MVFRLSLKPTLTAHRTAEDTAQPRATTCPEPFILHLPAGLSAFPRAKASNVLTP